jgi:hypothetical protein
VSRGLLTFILLAFSLPSYPASVITTRSFSESDADDVRVLSHVEHKAVIAEFLDPVDTGIGRSMAHMLWREVLSAISDQSGAGVILARSPGEERLVDLLKQNYHRAALKIAEHQDARMALWGIVNELDDQVFVTSHLSLIEATRGNAISYKITQRGAGQVEDESAFSGEVEFTMPRTKFNFPTVRSSREVLFQRPLMVTRASNVRAGANVESERIDELAKGDVAQGINMEGGWFKLRLRDGREGFITASNVDLAPLSVRIDRRGINLRSRPKVREETVVYTGSVNGRYRVLEHRFTGNRLWYRIEYERDLPVWVAASLTETVYSMPVVHFIAGMYRYFAGRHADARREFQRFVDYPDVKHRNVNLSVAYQYQALSNLLAGRSINSTNQLLEKARTQTPLDATTYKIEALNWIGDPDAEERVYESLLNARKLDPRNTDMKLFDSLIERQIDN